MKKIVFLLLTLAASGVVSGASRAWEPAERFADEHAHRGKWWWGARLCRNWFEVKNSGGIFDIVLFGDSITHFWEYDSGDAYASLTNRLRVLNLGYGGDNTRQLIWRAEHGQLDGYRARAVVLLIGTNNRDPAEDTVRGIRRILDLIAEHQPGAVTLLMPILPRDLYFKGNEPKLTTCNNAVNVEIRKFADGKKVRWLDLREKLADASGRPRRDLYMDGLHLNARGYAIWRDALVEALATIPEVTAGWENISQKRKEFPQTSLVWKAPVKGLSVRKDDGAEGEVTFEGEKIRIRKTNARGRIVVLAPAKTLKKGVRVRYAADVSVSSLKPMESFGYLSARYGSQNLPMRDVVGGRWFGAGGLAMTQQVNSAPGMTYRKYWHLESDGTPAEAAIVVAGEPSESVWTNWSAENLDAAQAVWDAHYAKLSALDHAADRQDEDVFEKALAADIDHTAQIVVRDGVSRLVVDGRETPPIVYKAPAWSQESHGRVAYGGKPLQRAGVRIGVLNLRMGKLPTLDGPWSEKGFDVKAAVRSIRQSMRVGDETCFILAIGTSAYPKFTEEHPGEVWRREDGSVVRGNSGSAIPDEYNDGGKPDPGDVRWPWVSYTSPAWHAAVNGNVEALVSELRAQGLLKRIIGVHFYGYHDGQFAVPVADHSPCAKAEYARYLAERGLKPGDPGSEYDFFMKQIGFRALECFSRSAKKAFGKPIVAVRWCMLPFCDLAGAYDIGSFLRSDAVDVIVPQPTYVQRLPGLSQGVRLPCDTLHRHGKMMWYEFDLRTWFALEPWAQSVTATKGLCQADDLEMWQTIFRKHAGIMTAQRMGWWFYDMAGGWYHPSEIAKDIKQVFDFRRKLDASKPNGWHPDAALVIDELALALYNRKGQPKVPDQKSLVIDEWPRVALSGVPYDVILSDDIAANPTLLSKYKAVAWCGFLHPDDRQRKMLAAAEAAGVRSFVVASGGYSPAFFNEFVSGAGGYVAVRPDVVQVDMNGDFISVHCVVPGAYDFHLPFPARVVNVRSSREEHVEKEAFRISMTAGETCWFRILR